jgi:hypothetical protein
MGETIFHVKPRLYGLDHADSEVIQPVGEPSKWMESAKVEIGSMIIEKSVEIDGIGKSRDGPGGA